ncbi:hypothetical protein GLOTRDRAFT_109892, partial [Gloeophyllum trabeum ATCC 11539]
MTGSEPGGAPAGHDAPGVHAGATRYDVGEHGGLAHDSGEPSEVDRVQEFRDRIMYAGHVAPLDYVSDTPRPPVFLCEAFTAPPNLQKWSHPDPPITEIDRPPRTPSMPYSHMGIYRGPEVLGSGDNTSVRTTDGKADDSSASGRPRGLMMHAPTAPPPYPKPTDVQSWIMAHQALATPVRGPASAPVVCSTEDTYPTSVESLERPYNWIEDVASD